MSGMLRRFTQDFKHDLIKAINEFVKNSHDCYTREGFSKDDRQIVIMVNFGKNYITEIAVLDFGGMNYFTLKKSFLHFFDEEAARRLGNGELVPIDTFGGFGNGGKFSMIAAFNNSDLITFKDGYLSAMNFSNNLSYGFYEGFENILLDEKYLPENLGISFPNLISRFGNRLHDGCTVVRGFHPIQKITNFIKFKDGLLKNPQIRGLLRDNHIYLYHKNKDSLIELTFPPIRNMSGFESPRKFNLMNELYRIEDIHSLNTNSEILLTLNVANEQLKGLNSQVNNSVVFYSNKVVIAEYSIKELGLVRGIGQSEFIYGECQVNIMKELNLIKNDRKHFVAESEVTKALLSAVKNKIEDLCLEIESSTKRKRRQQQMSRLTEFSKILDNWKNSFLEQEFGDDFGGNGDTNGIDGPEKNDLNFGEKPKNKEKHDNRKTVGNRGGGERRRGNKYPRILLSGIDKDPFFNGTGEEYFYCHERATDIVQREQDVAYKYYWINCQKLYPDHIIERYGVNSVQWKLFQFQKTIDVVVLESINMMQRSGLEKIDAEFRNKLDMLRTRIIDSAYDEREILLEIDEKD